MHANIEKYIMQQQQQKKKKGSIWLHTEKLHAGELTFKDENNQ